MKSFDGYLKQKLGNNYLLLAGGSHKAIDDFLLKSGGVLTGDIGYDTDSHKIYFYNGAAIGKMQGQGLTLYGERNSTSVYISDGTDYYPILNSNNYTTYVNPKHDHPYLPLAGGTITGPITFNMQGTYLQNSLGYHFFECQDSDSSNKYIQLGWETATNGYKTYISGSDIRFQVGSPLSHKITITSAGRLGIGTTTPSQSIQTTGDIITHGYHHDAHDNNDSVLLAGGGYKDLSEFKIGDYLPLNGGTMTGNITFSGDNNIKWARNTDSATISFKNTGDGDTDSYMSFVTSDNGNEYFRFSHSDSSTNTEWFTIKSDGARVKGTLVSLEGHTHSITGTFWGNSWSNGGSTTGDIIYPGDTHGIYFRNDYTPCGIQKIQGQGPALLGEGSFDYYITNSKANTTSYLLLHTGNWTSYIDGRYLKLSGGIMTGIITFNRNGDYLKTSAGYQFLEGFDGTSKYIQLGYGTGVAGYLTYITGKQVRFQVGDGTVSHKVTITEAGRLGIGTASPSQSIHTTGDVLSNGYHHISHNNNDSVLLAGGSYKALSEFSLSGHTHSYLPLSGGTMTGGNISWTSDSHGIYFYNNCGIEKWSGYGPSLVAETGYEFAISSKANRANRVIIVHTGGGQTISGNLTAANFYTSSDINKKTNFAPIPEKELDFTQFTWRKSGLKSYGLIAQQVKALYPELVDGEEGNMTVNYSAALCLTVGQLQRKIKELEQRLRQLENLNK